MLKEIYEQPQTIRATLSRFVEDSHFKQQVVEPIREWLGKQQHIVFAASGSSRHASLFAEVRIEELSPIHVDVEYASELIYSAAIAHHHAGVIVVSQSGETTDTLAALRLANENKLPTLSITNVADSSMTHEASIAIVTGAGRERAIPATKSFTAQLVVLELLAILAADAHNTISAEQVALRLADLEALPEVIAKWLPVWHDSVHALATKYGDSPTVLFLGRGVHYPIAREGALKLKESAYIPAEAYPAGEFKHGPQALIEPTRPLVMLATCDNSNTASRTRYERVVQLMRDMRVQGATIIAVACEGDGDVSGIADQVIALPALSETGLVFAEVITLQLLSYFVAVHRGVDVDHPRNLVKAVVVE
jgi:glucosamine--fructose-6-phosphate aminotransferase (isomerizing)